MKFIKPHNFLIIYTCMLLLTNCNERETIELTLVNKTINYAAIFEAPIGENLTRLDTLESVYSRYLNQKDWENSLNKIEFELFNNTTDKIFLVFRNTITNESTIDTSTFAISHYPSDIYFEIKDTLGNNIFEEIGNLRLRTNHLKSDKDLILIEEQLKKNKIAREKSLYNTYDDELRLKNFKVLNPNERIKLFSNLSLPIPIDYNDILDIDFAIPMYKNNIYKFTLHYVVNKIDIENNLPQSILDSLRTENVIIRDIILNSKEINVFPKK